MEWLLLALFVLLLIQVVLRIYSHNEARTCLSCGERALLIDFGPGWAHRTPEELGGVRTAGPYSSAQCERCGVYFMRDGRKWVRVENDSSSAQDRIV